MDIAIIGAGNVGAALGRAFTRAGHRVTFGVRDPASPTAAAAATSGASLASIPEAVGRADMVILAVPFPSAADALAAAGDLTGRIVVDATNPMARPVPDGHPSGAAWLASLAPGARLVKAFNVLGFEHMDAPAFGDSRALLPVCGDDPEARRTVAALAAEVGFEAMEAGGLENAALLESLARLWGVLAFAGGLGRGIAFGLLRR
jgi:predicted dinucleotide-binding enzyme